MARLFLSAENPRWAPETEADLQNAIDEGLIGETHYLDLKESLGGKADNRETARDLASFAIDGGALIVGIAEDKPNRTFSLAPQPLNGLAERIENATRQLTDPQLSVLTTAIPSGADPTTGYLVVQVPISPDAPHMVDHRYYGRSSTTKYTLSDPEVLRLHQRRRATEQDVLALLREEIDEDPLAGVGERSHLFLVAQPATSDPEMLLEFTSGPNWNLNLNGLIQRAHSDAMHKLLGNIDSTPRLLDAGNGFRRSRGAARATPNIGEGRIFTNNSNLYRTDESIELQVFEDGGLRLYCSRLSEEESSNLPRTRAAAAEHEIFHQAAVNLTRRFLEIVIAASETAGYLGNWSLAVGLTRLRGRKAYAPSGWLFTGSSIKPQYDRDEYVRAAGTTWAELNEAPGAITRRLLGPLLRSLGVENSPGYATIFDS